MNQGALTAAAAGEEVVPDSEYRALEAQVRELQRLLGKKAMENELLREAMSRAAGPKKILLRSTSWLGDGQRARLPMRSASPARICPRCVTANRHDREDDRRCRMPIWSLTSGR
jgi:transposase